MKFDSNMKTACTIAIVLALLWNLRSEGQTRTPQWFTKSKDAAVYQLTRAAAVYQPGLTPRSIKPDGSVRLAPQSDWTCGFFPGSLWYAYELSGKKQLAVEADRFTLGLDSVQHFTFTHDLGFMLYDSYGNAYRLTGDKKYLKPLENGAVNLYKRYSPVTHTIRSWDFGKWQYPVIIDNMMNVDYLFWSAKKFNKQVYAMAAKNHADATMLNHFRKDYSSYHVVSYDTITGKAIEKVTFQGLADSSAWARGQAWGLYGFTQAYIYTRNQKYLEQAKHIAAFIMNHPRTPADKIPYWDYDDPKIPDTYRDVSAAAVMASGLLQLSTQVPNGQHYFKYAEQILRSLSTDQYLYKPGTGHYFILKHSVGALPLKSEIDTPINYADYYFLEALNRYAIIKHIKLN